MKSATELVSDIGSKAFDLQHHNEADITRAVKLLRDINAPMFDWLVRVLTNGDGNQQYVNGPRASAESELQALRSAVRAVEQETRKKAQRERDSAHFRDDPYDDRGHEHSVRAKAYEEIADRLAASVQEQP